MKSCGRYSKNGYVRGDNVCKAVDLLDTGHICRVSEDCGLNWKLSF